MEFGHTCGLQDRRIRRVLLASQLLFFTRMNYHFLPALLFALTLDAAHLVYQTKLPASLVASDGAGNAYLLNDSTLTKLDPNGHVIYSATVPEPGSTFGMAVDVAGN